MAEYILKNSEMEIGVSDLGGKLTHWTDLSRKTNLLWNGDAAYWDDRAPILFPFCGKCRDGVYLWMGKSYLMGIHGFLSHTQMKLMHFGFDELAFCLDSNEATRAVYPFSFSLTVRYRLIGRRLETHIEVGAGDERLPFSLGGHPGFLLDGSGDYRLTFSEECHPISLEITENGLLGKKRTPCPTDANRSLLLTSDRMGDCGLFLQETATELTLSREGGSDRSSKIRICFDGFQTLGLWKPADAPFLCVEPWLGLPAVDGEETDLAVKPGTQWLDPYQKNHFSYSFELIKE